MSKNDLENVGLQKLKKKKQLVSWLGAGVKVRNLQTLENLAKQDLNRRNDVVEDNSFLMSDIKNYSNEQSNYVSKLEITQSNLNMMCRSSVLVLVQDNNASLNVPGALVQNRLAPPNIQNSSKSGMKYHIQLLPRLQNAN